MNLNFFATMVGYAGLRKNSRNIVDRSRTRVVINSMFIYHFIDPDLRVETIFEKDEAKENGGVDCEIALVHKYLYTLVLKVKENLMQSLSALLLFFGDKKIAFKSSLDQYLHPFIIEFRIEEKIHNKTVVDVSRGTGGRVFLFFLQKLGGG